jgi:hypothetical protein
LGTGKGDNNDGKDSITAIRNELLAIKKLGLKNSVILIDDIRGFGTKIFDIEFESCTCYPPLQWVKDTLLYINPAYEVLLLGDMLLAYDASVYNINVSNVVKAATKLRLFDGKSLKNEELFENGLIISQAQGKERFFINALYKTLSDYKLACFWHEVWMGLVNFQNDSCSAKHYFDSAFASMQLKTQDPKMFEMIQCVWQNGLSN